MEFEVEVEVEVDNEFEVETLATVTGDAGAKRPSGGSGQCCCVPMCSNNRKRTAAAGMLTSYYRLPADPKRRNVWLKLIRRVNWVPKCHHRICSSHFLNGE